MRIARMGAIAVVLSLTPSQAVATTGAVEGGGVVLADSALCEHPPSPAAVHVTLVRDGTSWRVVFEGHSAVGCPVDDVSVCTGTGTLGEGVDIGGCRPLGSTGTLGPVVVCIPGPMAPPPVLAARGPLVLESVLGRFYGNVELILAGSAVEEAANLCV